MTDLAERQPPKNLEVEQALLGAVLLENAAYDKIAGIVSAGDFYSPAHARIFTQIEKVLKANGAADPILLKTCFEQDGSLEQIGGTVDHLRMELRRIKRSHGLGLVVVDYLQLFGSERYASKCVIWWWFTQTGEFPKA